MAKVKREAHDSCRRGRVKISHGSTLARRRPHQCFDVSVTVERGVWRGGICRQTVVAGRLRPWNFYPIQIPEKEAENPTNVRVIAQATNYRNRY